MNDAALMHQNYGHLRQQPMTVVSTTNSINNGGPPISGANNNMSNAIYSNNESVNEPLYNNGLSTFRWDPSNIRITSLAVEKTLEPLVTQITTLVNKTGPSNQARGQSKKAAVLVATMERAIEIFMHKGQEIASESATMFYELNAAIEDIRATGQQMSLMSREFVQDPCSSANRANIIKAARPLLLAVTRLLIVADMVDVQRLLDSLKIVENDLANLKNASSQQEVIDSKDSLWNNTDRLINEVDSRQPKDERSRFQLAAARAVLKKNRTLLLTASKVYVRHPEISEAKGNRDFAFAQFCEAVNTINEVAQDKSSLYANGFEATILEDNLKNIGKLAIALDAFDRDIAVEPHDYIESEMRPKLEASLERIITSSAAVADFVCSLRDECRFCKTDKLQERQDLFVDKCNSVRQALQDLLSEYMTSAASKSQTEGLTRALEQMYKKTRDLRRHLRQAAVDHVSYRFLVEPELVSSLVDAAKGGDEISVEEYAEALRKNSKMLMDVAYLNCCMSTNEIGVDRVNHSIKQLDKLSSQVINAAKILSARTTSKAAIENMDEFHSLWKGQVQDLVEALHKIIQIDDLLALSELHTKEDKTDGSVALQQDDKATFVRVGASISERIASVHKAVEAEMGNYEKCAYTDSVLKANAALKKSKDTFDRFHQNISRTFGDKNRSDMNKADFDRTTNELLVNLKQVRYAVRIYDEQDSETENDYEDTTYETRSKASFNTDIDEFPGVAGISNTRDAYRFISDEDKEKIAIYVENFRTEKNRFDAEVGKWDDNGNEIIAMAKKMCKIMMDMTDFTRGRGPLKTTMDVINAAKKISEYGTELDKIANLIAEQSPESETKRDLQGYLKEIALYCHQLNITSKVKAEVQNISGNLIVSGLDSATSLIQAAKNLMNAVVSTVKASWVASTMYNQRLNGQSPPITVVKWQEKKVYKLRR